MKQPVIRADREGMKRQLMLLELDPAVLVPLLLVLDCPTCQVNVLDERYVVMRCRDHRHPDDPMD
jgi:hypothetical protein